MPLQEKNSRPDRSEIQVSLNSISWPILLAVIPTLGAFVVGNAEDWGDFILILLILYYVYKWITGKTIYKQI